MEEGHVHPGDESIDTQVMYLYSPHPHLAPTPLQQMDWIGDKLSTLIKQGKKALSHEIAIMSDAAEDKVNDASGAWEEQDLDHDGEDADETGSTKFIPIHRSTSAKHRLGPRPNTDLMFPPISASAPIPISIPVSSSSMPMHSPMPSVGFNGNRNDREDMQAWASP
jgi:hypothetical protein